jgi:hypothetical protein
MHVKGFELKGASKLSQGVFRLSPQCEAKTTYLQGNGLLGSDSMARSAASRAARMALSRGLVLLTDGKCTLARG